MRAHTLVYHTHTLTSSTWRLVEVWTLHLSLVVTLSLSYGHPTHPPNQPTLNFVPTLLIKHQMKWKYWHRSPLIGFRILHVYKTWVIHHLVYSNIQLQLIVCTTHVSTCTKSKTGNVIIIVVYIIYIKFMEIKKVYHNILWRDVSCFLLTYIS